MAEGLINSDSGYAPHIEGTRIKVQQVAEFHNLYDWSVEDIAEAFRLTLEQVYAALSYYYGHRDQIDAAIASDRAEIERLPSIWDAPELALTHVTTPQEIAQEYPITADAVYQAIRSKRLAARQSGKTWLVLRRDAERLWGHKRKAG